MERMSVWTRGTEMWGKANEEGDRERKDDPHGMEREKGKGRRLTVRET